MTETTQLPFRNPDLPLEQRVEDLLSRLTREERVGFLSSDWPAVERLGLEACRWGGECLHGLCHTGRATVFPVPIALAATFDPALVQRAADAISTEARAKFHGGQWQRGGFLSLIFWTPNINLFRDPRWGRGQETYGEDPYLTGQMGAAFVRGLQGNHPRYLKTSACAKHYAVHSGPEALRTQFNAQVSRKVLFETYLPAFKALVDAGVVSVMGAYNAVNGFPCCGSRFLLEDTLRRDWGFSGFVVSDAGAIGAFHRHHKAPQDVPADDPQWGVLAAARASGNGAGEHVTRDAAESAAFALTSGCDMAIGRDMARVKEAHQRGLIGDEPINAALRRIFSVGFRLGIFDDPKLVPYTKYTAKDVQSPRHLRLARETAAKGAVLLKNNGILPLGPNVRTVAVSGPNAADAEVLLGNFYRGVSANLKTILEGIVARAPEGTTVTYLQGCELNRPNIFDSGWHIGLAEWADVAVAVIGNSPLMEGESGECIATTTGGDRDTMELPQVQLDYLRKLKEHSKKPVVAIVTGGSPIIMPQVHEIADAVLFVWYPGEQGGLAVGDILFGHTNPSGRLPVTFPRDVNQVPDFADYSMKGRTYRYMTEDPLYPFGFGLSYTRFSYSPLTLSATKVRRGRSITAATTVTNTGDRAGEEVVQLYLTNHADTAGPRCNLRGIKRIALKPGESKLVRFRITPDMMELIDDTGRPVLTPGTFTVNVGPCSPGRRGGELGAAEPATGSFVVE